MVQTQQPPASPAAPQGERSSRWPFVVAGVGALLLFVLFAAVAGDDDSDIGTQPAPDVTTFEQGAFDQLPLPPRAESLGDRSEVDGVVAESYTVRGMSAEGVLAYYEGTLEELGWTMAIGPHVLQNGAWSGVWTQDQLELHVTAAPGEVREPPIPESENESTGEAFFTQFNLELDSEAEVE